MFHILSLGSYCKEIILSTGMSDLKEVEFAIKLLEKSGSNNISILHCNTEYPTPYEHVNLKVLKTLKEKFKYPIGYFDCYNWHFRTNRSSMYGSKNN